MASTSIANRTATAVVEKPIAEVVVEIRRQLLDADRAEVRRNQHRLAAGQLLLRLRQRIEAGEDGDIAWWDWFEENIERSRKDGERLMRIASAEDPKAALEVERAKDRERKRIARGADNGNVRSITRHVEAGCCSGDFVTVIETGGLDQPRKRRTPVEKRRGDEIETLIRFTNILEYVVPEFDDASLDLLTKEEIANMIEIWEKGIADLKKLVDRLRRKGS